MRSTGFILQPTYRIESGRPVVHLYGRLESGETFLVRDSRQVPHFYVRAQDRELARRLGARPLSPTDRRTLQDEPLVRVEVQTPPRTPPLRDRLSAAGVPCFEADVRFAMRYLIDRQIRGSLEIQGEGQPGRGIDRVYEDPEVRPGRSDPPLSILSFDIETDPKAQRLLAIALSGCGAEEVLLLTPEGFSCPPSAVPAGSEADLLRSFVRRVGELDPDILTGWNVIEFDLAVLLRVAERTGVSLELGRGPGWVTVQPAAGGRGAARATVVGRVVLDGLQLLRGSFIKMEEYGLDFVSREILGKGKTIRGADRGEEILRTFHEERENFVDYALNDARLVVEILERLRLVELAGERSRLTGMPLDRVSSSIAAFDFLYLSELQKQGRVAPTVGSQEGTSIPTSGGYVLSPEPGLYRNVLVFDFKSLYPSLIRTFQIDPLGYLPDPQGEEDVIMAPNGAAFRRHKGILTGLLDQLFPRREAARKAGEKVASHAIKILMNSFYGVLGTPACRFHNPALANAITSFGRQILLWSKEQIESRGHRVLYGDTDSLFVDSEATEPSAARRVGEALASELNHDLSRHIEETWRVESHLELEFETLYLRLLLPAMRGGKGGARKRYAGLVQNDGETQVVFTGMEVVRRDWTELARQVQRELYERLFRDRPLEEYLRKVVEELRDGNLDELLVYRKTLRKDLDAYTETTPPHVAAARKLSTRPRRRILYYITSAGPEPAEERQHPPDYEHYVDKQIRPVAEPVLNLLGLDFARVIGDNVQLELF